MKKILLSVIFSFLVLLSPKVFAATFTIDSANSLVLFKVDHIAGYTTGGFQNFSGYVKVDDQNNQISSLAARVDVASVYTRNKERDELLKSDLFFDAEKFPEAMLVGKKIKNGKLICDVTLHGKTKEVVFDISLGTVGKNSDGQSNVRIFANGQINRKNFGMKFSPDLDNKQGKMIGSDVKIKLELEGVLTNS